MKMFPRDFVREAKDQIRDMIAGAISVAVQSQELPDAAFPVFTVEIPADSSHGDFAANTAMVSAKAFRLAPAKIANIICKHLDFSGTHFQSASVAGPGFLNFFLGADWYGQVILEVSTAKSSYGRTNFGAGEKVMVEFVSANPTGPMHMGNARGAALGDVLAGVMEAAGFDISREFYLNDAGNQIEKFAISLEARYLQIFKGEEAVPFPDDGYQGDDIKDRARQYADIHGDKLLDCDCAERRQKLSDFALPINIDNMKNALSRYRVNYDLWFRESELYNNGLVEKIVSILRQRGHAYDKDGAIWYAATNFGAEKDEVLIRQNGNPTYFAADIAYHYNKFAIRGFSRVINIWGADHHGHVARLKGALDALDLNGDKLSIVLMQLVRLLKDGEPYRMSKRSGRAVSLVDLLDDVPIDAARFFFNMNSPGSAMDFDLDLAIKQSSDNPVYYVQYAHARICSIISRLGEEGISPRECSARELSAALIAPEELALIRLMARFPGDVASCAARLDPSGMTHFATELANLFHKFYAACRVKGEEDSIMYCRLFLCSCVRIVLANLLSLLKVDSPSSM